MMPNLSDLLEGESRTVGLKPNSFERLLRRRDRKLRNQRLTAGVVAIAVFVAAMWFLAGQFSDRIPTPTIQPKPPGAGALAYAVRDGDIYVADWDGGNPVRIADGRPPNDCHGIWEYWAEGPMWSPDGRYLAYRHEDCQDPRDWGDVVISDPEGNVITSFPSEGWEISWSPDSRRVAVWVDFEETIGVYGLDGVRQTLLTVPPGWPCCADYDPVWSRDGDSLLVPGGEVPLDGSPPRKLPGDDHRSEYFAAYSPEGSRVAYYGEARRERDHVPGGYGSLVVAEADGSHAREVVASHVLGFVWSPNGDRIAFTYLTGYSESELRVFDVATETVTSLPGVGGSERLKLNVIEFSSEGDRILFSRDEGPGPWSLWSINVDGSHPRRLVRGALEGDWR
jgi:Tol biopolymer transport system component